MFLRRKLFLLLFGSLTSFLLVCYFVNNERETAGTRRRVMEIPLETIQSKEKGKSSNISNTRDSISSEYPNTERKVEIRRAAEYFRNNSRCLDSRSTMSRVFDISSKIEFKQKLRAV